MSQTRWETTSKRILQTAKFLKAGTKAFVKVDVAPKEVTVKGRWGERQLFIIETVEYGLVYVTPVKLVEIAEVLEKHNYKGEVTVEL